VTVRLDVLPAADWATFVANELAARLRAEPALRLCLPTGDTPAPVYAALPGALAAARSGLGSATVVLLDEWLGLPAGDPARCDTRLRHELLDRVGRPSDLHLIRVDELQPEAAAAAHDVAVAEGLDLALLGLGTNGHVGFNEPGSTADSPTRVVELDHSTLNAAVGRYGATRRPAGGVTVGLARLLEAVEIWLLVTGHRKATVLARALEAPETPDCPASFLRRHPALRVLADEPAAAGLSAVLTRSGRIRGARDGI